MTHGQKAAVSSGKYADLAYPDPRLDPYVAAELRSAHSGDIAYPLPVRVLNPREMLKPELPMPCRRACRLPVMVRCQRKTARLDRKSVGTVNAGAAVSSLGVVASVRDAAVSVDAVMSAWARSRVSVGAAASVWARATSGLGPGIGAGPRAA